MKTLYVVRHAKSSWDDPLLNDFLRPLNERGKNDAPKMAKRLLNKNIKVSAFLSSPANRALATAKILADVLEHSNVDIQTNNELYHASPEKILEVLRMIEDEHAVVMIFGHNPGLTDFVNRLMSQEIDNIPTCGIAACNLDVKSWRDVSWNSGKLFLFDYPKNMKGLP